mgnify:CR=1 FL=1
MKRIVIIGATSGIAEACARLWVKDPIDLVLVGRNINKLETIAQDLRVRSPQSVIQTIVSDFANPTKIQSTIEGIWDGGAIDTALIAHGSLPDQQDCQGDLSLCKDTLEVNGISPVLFAEALVNKMHGANHGTLGIIGSVAGDRGRKSNYVYGAAKGLVARYAQGLQHRLAKTNVRVVLIKPGPTDTPMTTAYKARGLKMTSPSIVAQCIVEGIGKGKAEIYAPGKWKIIMLAIIHIPGFIFNTLEI